MASTWYPAAFRVAGPPSKIGYANKGDREGEGVVVHSAEGSQLAMTQQLQNPASGVSWHFSVFSDGAVEQHYPLETMCWHAKTPANYLYAGIECEGKAGDPVDGIQLASLINLLDWIRNTEAWPAAARGVTLWEHNQFVATACPSGRIPWPAVLAGLKAPALPASQAIATGMIEDGFKRILTFADGSRWTLVLEHPRFQPDGTLAFDVQPPKK
jgi:hypothetical protein